MRDDQSAERDKRQGERRAEMADALAAVRNERNLTEDKRCQQVRPDGELCLRPAESGQNYCVRHVQWPSHGPRRCQAYQCANRKEDVSDFCTDHWIQVNLAYRCGHSGAIAVAPEKATIPNQNEARRVARQFDCGECTIV